MNNPIVAQGIKDVDEDGPDGAATAISLEGADSITIINDGPDDINFWLNVNTDDIATDYPFAATNFPLRSGEDVSLSPRALHNFFAICDTGNEASVRYLAHKIHQLRGLI